MSARIIAANIKMKFAKNLVVLFITAYIILTLLLFLLPFDPGTIAGINMMFIAVFLMGTIGVEVRYNLKEDAVVVPVFWSTVAITIIKWLFLIKF